MRCTWSTDELAWLEGRLRDVNGRRTARRLDVETIKAAVERLLGSELPWLVVHGGDVDDGRQHTSLCLCVVTEQGVVVGLAQSRTGPASPARAFADLDGWDFHTPTANHVRCERWAARKAPDRRQLRLESKRPMELLDSVLADPDDDRPRRVYADALMEQGDPRGEFIAVQCELATGAEPDRRLELERREATLLEKHGAAWTGPLHPSSVLVSFSRGFITELTVLDAEGIEACNAFLSREPISQAVISTRTPLSVARLLQWPWVRTLDSLAFRAREYRPALDSLPTLLQTRKLHRLRALSFDGQGLYDEGASALAESAGHAFPALRSLELRGDRFTARAVEALLHAKWFLKLERLALEACSLGSDSAALLSSAPFARLKRLSLASNPIGTDGALHLAKMRLASLESLWLTGCRIRQSGAEALLDSKALSTARLFLEGNSLPASIEARVEARSVGGQNK